MKENSTKKQKVEFSKKLLYVVFAVTGIIIAFTLYIVWETKDTTPLTYLIPAIFVEVATATGFYYWKARKENEIKLKSIYGDLYKDGEDEYEEY